MRKIRFYLPLLFISFCVLLVYCTKTSENSKRLNAQNVSKQTQPPPTAPAVLKKVCIQQGGNPVHCIKQVWQCTFDGYTLQWDINTNFVYPLEGPTGSLVGAPIPTVIGGDDNYTTAYAGGSPFPTFLIAQSYSTSGCTPQSTVTDWFQAVGGYEDSLNKHLNPPNPPIFDVSSECMLGNPAWKYIAFKLVIYSFDGSCNPTFAVTTLDWKPATPKKCLVPIP